MNPIAGETVMNLGENAEVEKAFISKQTDPVITPQPYAAPADFAAQYPTPLDVTELITLCEEVNLLREIPDFPTSLNSYTWREMTSLAFTSGSAYIAFADGSCPEEYTHDGANSSVYEKNFGAKKSLSIRDIKHSMAVAAGNYGINSLVDGFAFGEGLPGGADTTSFARKAVADVKAKELTTASVLLLNGLDRLIVQGNASSRPLEFNGFENWAANQSCTFHTNDNSGSGTFGATGFDRFLSEACAKPTTIFGHPQAIQEMMAGYMILGFQGSQIINFNSGNRITPGFNFGGFVNTGVGQLRVVADANFTRTASGGTTFQADLWAMRMTHNGEPLVYRLTQIPVSVNDLAPGCTAVSFEVWTATTLVIKACCAQGRYTTQFTGRIVSTCTTVG